MFRSVLPVSLTYIHSRLKIPFMNFPDFLRDARQTCIETCQIPAKFGGVCFLAKNEVFDRSLLSHLIYIVLGLEYFF